jgi:hypothetical protein
VQRVHPPPEIPELGRREADNSGSWAARCIDGSELIRLVSKRITENRRLLTEQRIPCRGERNWRFEVQPDFKFGVRYEIRLQKAIAILLHRDWANAIPTASGVTECEETARSIDLV